MKISEWSGLSDFISELYQRESEILTQFDIDDDGSLELAYLHRSYSKPILSVIEALIKRNKTPAQLAALCDSKYSLKWQKLAETYFYEYEPLANTDVETTITDTTSEEHADSTSEEHTDSTSEEHTDSTSEEHTDSTSEEHADSTSEEHVDSTSEEHTDSTSEEYSDSSSEEHEDTETRNLAGHSEQSGTQAGNSTQGKYSYNAATQPVPNTVSSDSAQNSSEADTTDTGTIVTDGTKTLANEGTKTLANEGTKTLANEGTKTLANEGTKTLANEGTKTLANEGTKTLANEGTKTLANEGTKTITYSHTEHRVGNIGVTTTAQLIEAQRELYVTLFIDSFMGDLDEFLTVGTYDD